MKVAHLHYKDVLFLKGDTSRLQEDRIILATKVPDARLFQCYLGHGVST